jgi:hypothetical protein
VRPRPPPSSNAVSHRVIRRFNAWNCHRRLASHEPSLSSAASRTGLAVLM